MGLLKRPPKCRCRELLAANQHHDHDFRHITQKHAANKRAKARLNTLYANMAAHMAFIYRSYRWLRGGTKGGGNEKIFVV